MKKFLLTIAVVLAFGFSASAQYGCSDAFYQNWDENEGRFDVGNGFSFVLPSSHGSGLDTGGTAPLGSGLLVLTALGAGYVASKRKSVHAE